MRRSLCWLAALLVLGALIRIGGLPRLAPHWEGGAGVYSAGTLPPPPLNPTTAAAHPDVAELCSPAHRQRNAEAVHSGALPAVLNVWDCEGLRNCSAPAAARLVTSYRRRQLDLLEFLPCDLFREFQGRTLWLLGDSQIARWYRALRCFMSPLAERREGGLPPRVDETITSDPELLRQMDEKLLAGFTGDQFGNMWHDMVAPMCTHLVGGTRICHGKVHLAQQLLARYLPNLPLLNVSREDVIVLNVGLWHHPAEEGQYRELMQQLAGWYSANHERLPRVIWRETSLQHFMLPTGEYPNPGDVEAKLGANRTQCRPLEGVLLRQDGSLWGSNAGVVGGGWRNAIATPLLEAAGMEVLRVWNESLPMHDLHEPGECTHFCTPGGYNVWVWQLWKQLRRPWQRRQSGWVG